MVRYACATGKHNGHDSSRAASSCFVQADDARVATLERTVVQSILCHGDWTLDDHINYLLQDERSPETSAGEARSIVLRVHDAGHVLSDCIACAAGESMVHKFEG